MATQFLLYTDKSSLLKKNSRYVQGGTTDVLSYGLGYWDERGDILTNQIDDIPVYITADYAQRADKIAFAIYGRTDLEWLVLQYNNIVDITTELVPGTWISVPSALRTFSDILTNNVQYQAIT